MGFITQRSGEGDHHHHQRHHHHTTIITFAILLLVQALHWPLISGQLRCLWTHYTARAILSKNPKAEPSPQQTRWKNHQILELKAA